MDATSPWQNNAPGATGDQPPPPLVVLGTPGDRRLDLFAAAAARLDFAPPVVVAYADLLAGRADLRSVVTPGALVRVDAPGREFAVERLLLALGAEEPDDETGYLRLSRHAAEALEFDRGRLLASRQWYLGFCAALRRVAAQLAECAPHMCMEHLPDVALMFDKRACHAHLNAAGVPVPRALGPVAGYEELVSAMEAAGWARVFVKLAHGSSAAGVVAYARDGAREQATTTVEMVAAGGETALYNSRRIRLYREPREIARLIDVLCRHRVHVEQWLPKAGYDGRAFDLRVVVIGGQARHTVARLSTTPFTNLHLLNARAPIDGIAARMGPAAWAAAQATCERALACFPRSLYAGVDLLIEAGYKRHAVLEVNAFGDLLPGCEDRGEDTYGAELVCALDDM